MCSLNHIMAASKQPSNDFKFYFFTKDPLHFTHKRDYEQW